MKTLLACCLFLFVITPALGSEGVTVRGGGDEIAFSFNEALRVSLREITRSQPALEAQVAPLALGDLVAQVTIFVVDQPLIVAAGEGEQTSVAVNDPNTRTIWIHRARWQGITSERLRQAIALHEYLSLARVEGTGRYPVSMAYLSAFEANHGADFLLGGTGEADPTVWRSRKIRCVQKIIDREFRPEGDYTDADPVKLFVRTTTQTSLRWRVAGRVYDLEYFVRSKVRSFPTNHSATLNLLLRQSSRSIESESSSGALYLYNERTVEWDDWGWLSGTGDTEDELRFEERVNEQERAEWTWERGRKRQMLSRTVTNRLPDGSLRSVRENLALDKKSVSDFTECTSKEVPEDEWISPENRRLVDLAVTSLNAEARQANETERAFRDCNPDTCARLETESRSALARFDEVWDSVFHQAQEMRDAADKVRQAERERLKAEWEAKKKAEKQAAAEAIAASRKKPVSSPAR